jgi:hypothetical protein
MGRFICIKRNAFPFQRKRRANDAIIGAVSAYNYSTKRLKPINLVSRSTEGWLDGKEFDKRTMFC